MTFLSAWRLLLLVAPLLLLVAYVLIQRRRHTQVVKFTSVSMLDSVAPKRSGWQRHIATAGALASLVLLTIAFAQPVMAIPTPKDKATILLTIDTSASMSSTDVSPNRLKAAEDQARAFVKDLPDGVQVGLVTFDTAARLLVSPTDDHAQVLDALGNLSVGPGTATADGIRTSLRLGARKAYLIYRRSEKEMPARVEEVRHAKEEGVELHMLTNPVEFLGDEKGNLVAARCEKMTLGEPDASGRRRPVPLPGSQYDIPLSMVVIAAGTSANPIVQASTPDLKTREKGYIVADAESLKTSKPGVFAGGDIVTGGATVILAMGAGRKAAKGIADYLENGDW